MGSPTEPAVGRARLLVLLLVGLAGCDTWHAQAVRPKPDDALALTATGEADEPAESKQLVKGFFKPTRPPGGWSPEANEIESHLGVR